MDPTVLSRLSQMKYKERLQDAEKRRTWAKRNKRRIDFTKLVKELSALVVPPTGRRQPCPEC